VLEIFAQFLYCVGRARSWESGTPAVRKDGAGDIRMRNLWAVLLAVALGLALGACSKCDVPDLLPKSCKTGTVTSGM